MHQAFTVSCVDFIAVLIIEGYRHVLKSFRNTAVDSRSATVTSLSLSNCEGRVAGGNLRTLLPVKMLLMLIDPVGETEENSASLFLRLKQRRSSEQNLRKNYQYLLWPHCQNHVLSVLNSCNMR